MLTKIKRGVITSLPETFFLTFPDNLWNLWFVDVQFWFWTEQQTLQGKLHDDLTEIIRRASALSSLEEGKEVSSLWSHSVRSVRAASTEQWPVSASVFQLWTLDGLRQEKNHSWRSRVIQWLVSMKQMSGQNALLLRPHFLSYFQPLSMQSLSLQWHSLPLPTWSS